MPIYEYHCNSCGCNKDMMQKMSDPVLTTCPECKAETFVKMLSVPGFQLKGSGWYATDFKGGSTKPAEAASEATAPASTPCGGNCACH